MQFRWFIVLIALYLLGFFAHTLYLHKTVYGDGIYYYSWIRSVVFDRDINFHNEFNHFSVEFQTTPTGYPTNKYAIGTPLLLFPTYLMHASLMKGTGYEFPYQVAVGATSVLYVLFGLALLYVLLSQYISASVARLTTIAMALATHLLFYGSLDTVNSHGLSFFAAVVFLYVALQKEKNWLLIGLTLGLVSLIRLQDIIYGILLIPPTFSYSSLKSRLIMLSGIILAFVPQLLAWQLLYGSFWVSPYTIEGEYFNLFKPHVFEVLFSQTNGLFLWTPLVLLGVVGFFFFRNTLRVPMLTTFFLQVLIVSTWSTPSQGASFSGRMFVSSLPLIAFGVGTIFQTLQKRGWTDKTFIFMLIAPLSLSNVLLIAYFLLTHS